MLSNIDLDNLKKELVSVCQPEKIYLFGSYTTGIINNDSDVDLLVIKNDVSNKPIERRFEIRKKLDWDFPYDLIVLTENEIDAAKKEKDPFILEIINKGKILYD